MSRSPRRLMRHENLILSLWQSQRVEFQQRNLFSSFRYANKHRLID